MHLWAVWPFCFGQTLRSQVSVDTFVACPHDDGKPVCCGPHVVLISHHPPSFLVLRELWRWWLHFPLYRPENHEPLPVIKLEQFSDNSQQERAEWDDNCKQETQVTEIFLLCLALWLWQSVWHELYDGSHKPNLTFSWRTRIHFLSIFLLPFALPQMEFRMDLSLCSQCHNNVSSNKCNMDTHLCPLLAYFPPEFNGWR